MNLPTIATTPREMADALDRVAASSSPARTRPSDLIDWTEDPVISAMVRGWPAHVDAPRASALGLHPEASFDDIVRAYLEVTAARGQSPRSLPVTSG